ncbi:HugZ family protein [Pontibacter sp. JAM-7]|uniref:HugZ family pyridoxamine 5'-phosphate oxidase n=1 Tax=Pontibacter sp. JAM-7 TaxID=3366581 RepID=UPI003AF928E8
MADDAESLMQLAEACNSLQQASRTLLISTLGEQQQPEISYAPFWRDETGQFWIFISELAGHCRNLLRHPAASVMFIRDEADSSNLFARERLTYPCRVTEYGRDSDQFAAVLPQMEQCLGKMISMLQGLSDFRLFCLQPMQGTYVVGFGRAYEVDPKTGLLSHIDEARLKQRGQ